MSTKQEWTFIGLDLGSGPDVHTEVEMEVCTDAATGKVFRKITQLYGRPGNIRFGAGDTIDLKKGKDGIWR